jgi:HK97 family phage portal protein
MFNFFRPSNLKNFFIEAIVDKFGNITFERHSSPAGYYQQYREIAPLADAIDKIAKSGSIINPYTMVDGNFVNNDDKNIKIWIERPNKLQTGILYRKEALIHFNATGNNFIEIKYIKKGNSFEIYEYRNINPALVSVECINDDIKSYSITKNGIEIKYKKTIDSRNREIDAYYSYNDGKYDYDLINFREMIDEVNASGLVTGYGLSKLHAIQDELILYQEGNKHNKRSLANSLSAKKMISVDLEKLPASFNKEDIDRYRKEIEEKYSGSENSGKNLFTNLPLKVFDLQNPYVARDLEFNQGLRRLRVAIYNRFDIPLPKVEGEFTSNSNMKESNANFYDEAVLPVVETYYDFIDKFIFKNYFPKLKYSKIFYSESEIPAISFRNAELVATLSKSNILTKNELRKKVGLNQIDGLNAVYIDGNQAPIGEDTNTGDAIGSPLSQQKELILDDVEDYEIDLLENQENEEKALSDINLKPTQTMANNAKRGLEYREKFDRGGTMVGVARARDISNRKNLSPSTVARMVSFFARHGVNEGKNKLPNGDPSNHYIAWLLWGGNAGRTWANSKWNAIKREREK